MAADYIKPLPRRARTILRDVQVAIAAGPRDASTPTGGGGGGGGPNALDVIAVGDGAGGNTTDVLQVDSTNDVIEAGTGS